MSAGGDAGAGAGGDGGPSPGRTILLVDAGPALRTVARLHLGEEVDVLEAPDEESAFELLRRRRVDLAICAAESARIEGLACLRRLRAEPSPSVRAVPVLLLSARPVPELHAQCAELGPAAVLDGPPTAPRLVSAVAALLAGQTVSA
jgi:CheY-like chemotaxis protein